jgi:hypothetical protein
VPIFVGVGHKASNRKRYAPERAIQETLIRIPNCEADIGVDDEDLHPVKCGVAPTACLITAGKLPGEGLMADPMRVIASGRGTSPANSKVDWLPTQDM